MNDAEDARRAVASGCLDYAGVGPLRFTPTKGNLAPVLGLAGVRALVADLGGHPGLGDRRGRGPATCPRFREAGAAGVAVSSALHRDGPARGQLPRPPRRVAGPPSGARPGARFHFMSPSPLVIAGVEFSSRLFVGTGKFSSGEVMRRSLEASGTQLVTVALGRVRTGGEPDDILGHLDPTRYRLLPNTSGTRSRARGRPGRRARARGARDQLAQARDPPRPEVPDARPDRDARGDRAPRQAGLRRAPVRPCRPGPLQAARGGGRRRGDAARLADREQPRPRVSGLS